jgi:hypothetical protein
MLTERLQPAPKFFTPLGSIELVGEPNDGLFVECHLSLRTAADGSHDEGASDRLVQLVFGNLDIYARYQGGRDPPLDLPEPAEEVEPAVVCLRGFRGPRTPSSP